MALPFQTVAAIPNASDANRRDYGIGAPSGPAGRGLLDLSYDVPTGLVTVTYSDLSTQRFGPVKGGPGQKGDDAVPPTFVTGIVTQGPAGSAPTFALRLVQTGVYAIDVTIPAGSAGLPGTPGTVIRSGSGAPASSLGIDGDYYLNVSPTAGTGDLYQRSAGVYAVVGNLRGSGGPNSGTATISGFDDGVYDDPTYQPTPPTASVQNVDDGTY